MGESILNDCGKMFFEAIGLFNPCEYFRTNNGLWVSKEFVKEILPFTGTIEGLGPATVSVFELKRKTSESSITSRLPTGHSFQFSELCGRVAQIIEGQFFLEMGNQNYISYCEREIFFYPTLSKSVRKRVVSICKNIPSRKWVVDMHWFDEIVHLSPGIKVVSRK